MTVMRLIARPMLASMFVVGGVSSLRDAEARAPSAAAVTDRVVPAAKRAAPQLPIPENPTTQVRVNGAVQVLGGLALATGKAPRLSAAVLAATLVPTTAAGHRFWEEDDPQARSNQMVHFFKNISMAGGLLIAGVDTEGKPSVAWRARNAAQGARKEARRTAKDAKREAKRARSKG